MNRVRLLVKVRLQVLSRGIRADTHMSTAETSTAPTVLGLAKAESDAESPTSPSDSFSSHLFPQPPSSPAQQSPTILEPKTSAAVSPGALEVQRPNGLSSSSNSLQSTDSYTTAQSDWPPPRAVSKSPSPLSEKHHLSQLLSQMEGMDFGDMPDKPDAASDLEVWLNS